MAQMAQMAQTRTLPDSVSAWELMMGDTTEQPGERIGRRLSRAGIASRREAERMIEEGRVRIGGRLCESPAQRVTAEDRIEVDGRLVAAAEESRIWRYHKPVGLLVSRRDSRGRPTIYDDLGPAMAMLMAVGRLDFSSEGLLLLTNDGALKRQLELPASGHERLYRVRVRGQVEAAALAPLRRGLQIAGERFRPMRVQIEVQKTSNAWLQIGVREGRYREIRRTLEHIGFPVMRLMRIGYGPFKLGSLPRGAISEVSKGQLAALTKDASRVPARAARPGRRQ